MSSGLLASIRNAKNKYSRNTGDTYKLKEGKTTLRILPYLGPEGKLGKFDNGEDGRFYADLGVHWIKTAPGGKPVAVVGDRAHIYGEANPIDQAIVQAGEVAKKSGDDDLVKLINEWRSRKSVLVNALVRSGPDASEDEPKVVELTTTTWGQIMANLETFMEATAEEGGDPAEILSLDKGIDFIIERKGKSLDTEYTIMTAPRSKPVKKDVLNRLTDLESFIETKFFKGDETKALTAIEAVTGISAPRLTSRTGAALLTSRAETTAARAAPSKPVASAETDPPWEDTEEVEAPRPAPKTTARPAVSAAPATGDDFGAPLQEDDVDSLLKELDGI